MIVGDIKYFRYIADGEYDGEYIDSKKDDIIFGAYKVLSVDGRKKEVLAISLDDYDPCEETFPFSLFEQDKITVLEEKAVQQWLEKLEMERREAMRKNSEWLQQKFMTAEKSKKAHFDQYRPKLKRGVKVRPIDYDKSLLDFSKKGDTFYVDDVAIVKGEIMYSLKAVCPRKSRGIYSFCSEIGFKDENLVVDADQSAADKDNCNVEVVDGVTAVITKTNG